MATWLEDIVSSMRNLGGTAHYDQLYSEILRTRKSPLPAAWKKIIQRQIQDHAGESEGFKSKRLFYSVNGMCSGVWGLVPTQEKPGSKLNSLIGASPQHIEDRIELDGLECEGITEAFEGQLVTRLHVTRERDRGLVEQCKKNALRKYGRLSCEICGFDFSKKYGLLGANLIDVHHTKPVHTLRPDDGVTRIEDLALLCSNCHRVVHATRQWRSLEEMRSALLRIEPL